jgi:hypothetical protein
MPNQNISSRTSGQTSRTLGQASTTSGQTSRTSGQTSRTSGQTSRTSGQASQSTGQTSRTSGQASRTSGQASRTSGHNSRTSGQTSRSSAQTSTSSPLTFGPVTLAKYKRNGERRCQAITFLGSFGHVQCTDRTRTLDRDGHDIEAGSRLFCTLHIIELELDLGIELRMDNDEVLCRTAPHRRPA